jgi:hypothetical protein
VNQYLRLLTILSLALVSCNSSKIIPDPTSNSSGKAAFSGVTGTPVGLNTNSYNSSASNVHGAESSDSLGVKRIVAQMFECARPGATVTTSNGDRWLGALIPSAVAQVGIVSLSKADGSPRISLDDPAVAATGGSYVSVSGQLEITVRTTDSIALKFSNVKMEGTLPKATGTFILNGSLTTSIRNDYPICP